MDGGLVNQLHAGGETFFVEWKMSWPHPPNTCCIIGINTGEM